MSPLTEPTRLILKKDSVAATDTNIREVSLLLHGNQSGGQFVDSSLNPKTVTKAGDTAPGSPTSGGNPVYPSSNSAFGSAIAFDGAGDYIAIAEASGSFTFGTDNFTIEFWFYPSNLTGVAVIADWRNVAGGQAGCLTLYRNSADLYFFESNTRIFAASALTNTVFQHIALCRGSNSTRLFVNGIQVGSTYTDTTSYVAPLSGSIYIGGLVNTVSTAGYIDDLRITKGVARYTSNFTPPTAPFPDF